MTTPSFAVDPSRLDAHAGSLAGYADQLAAIGSRLPDALGEQSLGSFAQFLTAGLGGAMTATLDAFAHAASTVDAVGGGVRQAAGQYRHTDEDNAAGLADVDASLREGVR